MGLAHADRELGQNHAGPLHPEAFEIWVASLKPLALTMVRPHVAIAIVKGKPYGDATRTVSAFPVLPLEVADVVGGAVEAIGTGTDQDEGVRPVRLGFKRILTICVFR